MCVLTDVLAEAGFGFPLRSLDWVIIIVFLAATTVVAVAARRRQGGIREFFLADRSLPWLAVCVSLIATEISAASYIGVPLAAYNGSLVYLQLAIGAILARFIIGYYFVPVFYSGDVYSPYQLMGERLGISAERMASLLFVVGAVIGQGARVFILARVLDLVAGIPMTLTILAVTALAAVWAAIGGIRSVVWTGVVQFGVLTAGCLALAVYLIRAANGGLAHILSQAASEGKLQVLDLTFDHATELTLWTGLFGTTFNTLASHGADQMNTQQLLSCRSGPDARKAIIFSGFGQLIVLLMLFIGLGLSAFFRDNPTLVSAMDPVSESMAALPFFIATVLPDGLKGLLVAGLLAAGISSLTPALAALGQTTCQWSRIAPQPGSPGQNRSQVRYSRFFTVLWAVGLAITAVAFEQMTADSDLLHTALKLTSFTYGALIGALLLSLGLKKVSDRGVLFGASFAVLTAFGMIWHDLWANWILTTGVVAILAWWGYVLFQGIERRATLGADQPYGTHVKNVAIAELPATLAILAAGAVALVTHWIDLTGEVSQGGRFELAWAWYLPMGAGITVLLGYLLGHPTEAMEIPRLAEARR